MILDELQILAYVAGYVDVEIVQHPAGWDCWATRTTVGASPSLIAMGDSGMECLDAAVEVFRGILEPYGYES